MRIKLLLWAVSFCILPSLKSQVPQLYIPVGHGAQVTDAAFTPDGEYLFTTSKDKTLKIWEVPTGREIKTISNMLTDEDKFTENVEAIRISPKGKWVATFSYFVTMVINTGNLVPEKKIKIEGARAGDFSPDESYMIVATGGTLEKINLKDYSQTTVYKQDQAGYFDYLKISADGKWLMVSSVQKKNAYIFNTSNWQKVAEFSGIGAIFGLSPAGTVIQSENQGNAGSKLTCFSLPDKTVLWQKDISVPVMLSAKAMDFNQSTSKGILGSGYCYTLFDYKTGDFSTYIYPEQKPNYSVTKFYPSGNEIFQSYGNSFWTIRMELRFLASNTIKRTFTSRSFNPATLNISPVSTGFTTGGDASTMSITLADGHISVNGFNKGSSGSYSKYSGDGKLLFTLEKAISKEISIIDTKTNQLLRKISYRRDIHGFAVSFDGSKIAFHEGNSLEIANSTDGSIEKTISTRDSDIGYVENFLFSPDASKVISYIINENEGRTICMWDLETGNILWSLPEYYVFEIFYLPGNTKLMLCTFKNGIVIVDAATGTPVPADQKPFMKKNFISVSQDGLKGLLHNEESNVYELWDLAAGVKKGNIKIVEEKGHNVVFKFLNNSKLAVSRVFNTIIWWDIETLQELARMTLFRYTDDWVLYTPDGHFDATPLAMQLLYFVDRKEVIPFDALYEKFYTPFLLAKLMAGIPLPPPGSDIKNLKSPPIVKLTYAEMQRNLLVDDDVPSYQNGSGVAEITVTANSKDDAIDEIRLFHNGKIITMVSRNLIVEDEKSAIVSRKYTINLLPGSNAIRAVALNTQRTESKPDEITVVYKKDNSPESKQTVVSNTNTAPISPVDKNATLHLVVIGINAYQNPSMNLNYALADATAIKTEIEKDSKTVLTNTKTYFVTDANATKAGIVEAFKQVQQNAKAQDVFIFYYAGHGVIGKDKEFYLVPNDVSDLKNVQSELEQKGIAAKLLQQYAIDIQAQKQLFILDACQSAGAFNEMLATSGDQQKSIAVVSRSTGTHWMAASGAQQYANEFSQLGHGAFTYVLLEALKGSAATDKMITVNGLKNYLQQGVPELMKKYSGTLQYPASYGFGNDFPVEVMK